MHRRLMSVVLMSSILLPSHVAAQRDSWVTQIEGYLGWRSTLGEVTRVEAGTGSGTSVELRSAMAYGGRIIFPIANAPSQHLGKVFVGVEGYSAFGSDMAVTDSDSVVGKADYFQLGAVLGIGKFIPASPVNLTLHGALSLGVARTVFDPVSGIALVDGGNSTTSLVTSGALGLDLCLAPMFSVVTSAAVNVGFTDPLNVSVVLVGGVALRLPTGGS